MAGENSQVIVDRNKQLIRRWFEEVWDKGRRDAIHELLAENCLIHDGSGKFRGPDEFARFHDGLQAEFANFKITPIVALGEGDLVCMHWNANSVHRPTKKNVQVTGITVARVADGKFVEAWQSWDKVGLLAQVPEMKLG